MSVEREFVHIMIGKESRTLNANGLLPKGERFVVGENTTIHLQSDGNHLLLVSFLGVLADQSQLPRARRENVFSQPPGGYMMRFAGGTVPSRCSSCLRQWIIERESNQEVR